MSIKIKNVGLVAKTEYIKWITNPRILMILVAFIPVRELILMPMIRAAEEMQQPLNVFEGAIGTVNSGWLLLLFPLVYIVLIAAFPTMDGNIYFYISRMGRINWYIGEVIFQFMAVFSYILIIICLTVVQTLHMSFWENGWSLVVTDFDKVTDGLSGIFMNNYISPNLYFQMTPYKAFFLSYILLALFMLFCSLFVMIGSIYEKKIVFYLVMAGQMVAGYSFLEINVAAMWAFPFSHMVLDAHFQKYMREYVFSPYYSILILSILVIITVIAGYRKAKNVSLDLIGGEMR